MRRAARKITLALILSAIGIGVCASPALAEFESEAEETIFTVSSSASGTFKIKADGLTMHCTDRHVEKTVKVGRIFDTVTWDFFYTSCHDVLGQKATIDTNGCDWVSHLASNATTGTTDLECPTATGMQLTIGSICTYEIDTQTGLSSVSYSNSGSGSTREIIVQPNVSGITMTRTTNHFFCPAAGSEGTYTGNFTVTGESPGGSHVGIFVD